MEHPLHAALTLNKIKTYKENKMDIFTKCGIIISAERAELSTEENARRSADMVAALVAAVGWNGSIIPCTGSFEGVEEQSYIVIVGDAVADEPELARSLMAELLLIAYKFDQDGILVFHDVGARLVELPQVHIIGEVTDDEIKEGLMYTITGGDGLVSDLMYFEEVDEDDLEHFEMDYTEVFGRYYTLVA